MSNTPMKKLKNSFLNFEKVTMLPNSPTILHGREEKSGRSYYSGDKKAINTDFIKLYRLNNNSFSYKTLAFNIDYIDIKEPIFTVSIKLQDETIISSKPMDYETFKSKLNLFNKQCNLISDIHRGKTRVKIDSEIYSSLVSMFDISTRDFDIKLIEDEVSVLLPMIKRKVNIKHSITDLENTIDYKKTKVKHLINDSEQGKEYRELLIQQKELEKRISEIKLSLANKEKDLVSNDTKTERQELLSLKQDDITAEKLLNDSINTITSQHPKNAAAVIRKMISTMELKEKEKIENKPKKINKKPKN